MKIGGTALYAEQRASVRALRLEYGVSQNQKENFTSRAQWERARSMCVRGWEQGRRRVGTRDGACGAFKTGTEFGFYAKCTKQAIITFLKQESNNLINV